MLDKTKRLAPAIALLASMLVSLPIAQSQANANAKHTGCNTSSVASRGVGRLPYASPKYNKQVAYRIMANTYNWCGQQYLCLNTLWERESGWSTTAHNPSGAHGIPQALPGSKMGRNWESNPYVQINWGLKYISNRYGTPCQALNAWFDKGWY